ncbi:molybdate ABC transporter substrate-binding protein [Thiothrix nivea]|uniref:Molybdenum ABC transporter, periplasmic molybdate-binding protein n=1 Tax=Thiothrix nivea (strain ATCC 35100 / DSM 5205 / JP2) TaxID=870187 RepID=A0A656HKF4_THINJ|nr:molybdate ABC transporter substrate-binding protein [Thiothrix nivea]EIJ36763.1 molybdenum ABC transporter, periplasmic molybdate-binding protein [Thiothrix nivea DSM 5205]
MKVLTGISLIVALVANTTSVWANDVHVAVAANFTKPMESIAADFEKATGNKIIASFGSSGKLLEQIKHGAPFEVFLSADQNKPLKAEEEKLDVPGSRFTYSIGKLVLWSAKEGMVDDKGEVLKTGSFAHIAIANPDTAPYGKAAMETMTKLGMLETLQPKIVQGDSIAQTKEFISSGNAELGFVALSQVIKDGKIGTGSGWLVTDDLYTPMNQDAILLKTGENNAAAQALMDYLKSDAAKAVIESFGYALPETAAPEAEATGQADAK